MLVQLDLCCTALVHPTKFWARNQLISLNTRLATWPGLHGVTRPAARQLQSPRAATWPPSVVCPITVSWLLICCYQSFSLMQTCKVDTSLNPYSDVMLRPNICMFCRQWHQSGLCIEATGPWTSWMICSVVAMVLVSWAQTRPRLNPLLMCGYSCVACTVSAQPAPALGRELQCSCCYPARAVAHSFYPDHSSGGVLGVATTIAIAVKCSTTPQATKTQAVQHEATFGSRIVVVNSGGTLEILQIDVTCNWYQCQLVISMFQYHKGNARL